MNCFITRWPKYLLFKRVALSIFRVFYSIELILVHSIKKLSATLVNTLGSFQLPGKFNKSVEVLNSTLTPVKIPSELFSAISDTALLIVTGIGFLIVNDHDF